MKEMELFIGCLIMSFSIFIIGNIIFDQKEKLNIKNITLTLCLAILITIVNIISTTIVDNILKLIIIFVSYIGYYKVIFKKDWSTIILGSFIMYLIYFFSEIIIDIIIHTIFHIFEIGNFQDIKNTIELTILTTIVGVYISVISKKYLKKMVKETSFEKGTIIIIAVLIIAALATLLYKTPLMEVTFDLNFFITMFLVIVFCMISFVIIKQQRDVNEKEEEYKKLANYSQVTEGVLEEYRLNLHESRNQLIIIRNMIPTTKKKELEEYVNNLIDATEVNKYRWVNELKYIPIPELKGFINFKLMEMSNKKIDIEINVERKLKNSKMKKLKIKDKGDLYNIIGVFLDNAKEASLESKEKRVAVEMYEMDNDLHIIIANTYKGKVDIEKINEYGYSSKGKNRGTGLHLVNKIVERNRMFERTTSKMDEYFVQELTVHLENID